MIADNDCFPPSIIPTDCVLISDFWSEIAANDRGTDEFASMTEWLSHTAEHAIGVAIRSGTLHVFRSDGRRILPRTFDRGVYLDRSIKGGALRTIERDEREGMAIFASRSQFEKWRRSTAAQSATISTTGAEHRATEWLVAEIRRSPDHPPAGRNRTSYVEEMRERFAITSKAGRDRVWPAAIRMVSECGWSKAGRKSSRP